MSFSKTNQVAYNVYFRTSPSTSDPTSLHDGTLTISDFDENIVNVYFKEGKISGCDRKKLEKIVNYWT